MKRNETSEKILHALIEEDARKKHTLHLLVIKETRKRQRSRKRTIFQKLSWIFNDMWKSSNANFWN